MSATRFWPKKERQEATPQRINVPFAGGSLPAPALAAHELGGEILEQGVGVLLALRPGDGRERLRAGFLGGHFVGRAEADGLAGDADEEEFVSVFRDLEGEGGEVAVDDGDAVTGFAALLERPLGGPFVDGGMDARGASESVPWDAARSKGTKAAFGDGQRGPRARSRPDGLA